MHFPKRLFLFSSLISLSLVVAFCKKEDAVVEESPVFQLFNDASISIDTVTEVADTWDYGFAFRPVKSGVIDRLAMKLPREGSFTVTLWDLNGIYPVALTIRNMTQGEAHQTGFQDISGVRVEKGKKYGISILANTFYRITRAGGEFFDFPRVIGNIEVGAFHEAINTTGLASFPSETNDTRVAPCVDVIFIAD